MEKIFHIVHTIHVGGSENVAISLAEGFKQNNQAECTIVEIFKTRGNYSDNLKEKLALKGIDFLSLSPFSKRISLLIAPFVLLYYCAKKRPTILHAHTDLPDFVLSLAIRLNSGLRKRVRIVRTIHNTKLWYTHPNVGAFVEKMFVQDFIAAVSQAALESYKKLRIDNNLEVSKTNCVIYNGCVVPEKQPHSFKINSSKINIVYCGRLVYQKGIDILVQLINAVSIKFPDQFLFHIVGGGEDVILIENITKELKNVIYYGEVPQMSSKLYPFDFLLMPSRFEGLPLVTIEASLSRLPVIASNIPGLTETLPTNWPLLFDINNQKEGLEIFDGIVNQSFNKKELQNTAFAFAQARFSLQSMLDAYSELYSN